MTNEPLDVLVVTGGHPYQAEPFFAVFDSFDDVRWSHATTPEAGHDVVVFYDMPGLRFTKADPPVEFVAPTTEQQATIEALLASGTGLVFMHHAAAGWPTWERYAEIVGGRFHYQPGRLAGVDYPDSGYVFDVRHTVEVLASDHPVCAGLPERFDLTDELYCFPVLDDRVIPLMRTSFDTSDDRQFFSADLAIRGQRNTNEGWSHPAGSPLVGWARSEGRSPIVYLQFGDGPVTYADTWFRRVLHNAIGWVASDDAHRWALNPR
jgi:uncharacterized protein